MIRKLFFSLQIFEQVTVSIIWYWVEIGNDKEIFKLCNLFLENLTYLILYIVFYSVKK